ncbi:MAG TPA: Gfo/Idh/MocA family oxidoreductase [Thermoleophilaceae bacterium]
MSELRAGVVGYGLAGEVFHAPLIDAVDGIEVAGIVTTDPERQASARSTYPNAEVVYNVEDLWDRIDLLVVATPNRAHVPLGLAGVEHGLPVVVDKPLAPSVTEAELLLSTGGQVTVFQNRRFDGDFLTLRGALERGELGTVTRFESRFERFRPTVGDGWRELGDPGEGGGLLLDLGAHLVDQARVLFGPPLRVYGELHARRPGAQVEDDVFVALEHEGGVRSHLWMSAVAPLYGPRFRVSGLEAGFSSDGLDPQEEQLSHGVRPGDPLYGEAADLLPGAYQRFYEGVVAWLRDGAPAPVDPRDSLACLRVLEAARRSAETNSVIELEGT